MSTGKLWKVLDESIKQFTELQQVSVVLNSFKCFSCRADGPYLCLWWHIDSSQLNNMTQAVNTILHSLWRWWYMVFTHTAVALVNNTQVIEWFSSQIGLPLPSDAGDTSQVQTTHLQSLGLCQACIPTMYAHWTLNILATTFGMTDSVFIPAICLLNHKLINLHWGVWWQSSD